ncbi:MAG TPA: metallophosphoesterase family protein [Thermomicrobiales bacterium]|nr:metallophosphoesterase family protein [Thermomicrobiales bacterium]
MKVLLISDVHANLTALDAVLADAGEVDTVWNLGDTVGYGPKPRECLDRMVDLFANPVLVGNHDLACIGEVDISEFNPVAQLAARWTSLQLGMDHRAYLNALPAVTLAGAYTLAHGSPRAPVWEYVTTQQSATENFQFFDTDVCFIGHTHVAMYASLPEGEEQATICPLTEGATIDLLTARFLINPGSVGQPRDRDPRAAYAILDTDTGLFTSKRVEYDIALTQRQMAMANLPDVLISRLAHGM